MQARRGRGRNEAAATTGFSHGYDVRIPPCIYVTSCAGAGVVGSLKKKAEVDDSKVEIEYFSKEEDARAAASKGRPRRVTVMCDVWLRCCAAHAVCMRAPPCDVTAVVTHVSLESLECSSLRI